MFRPILFASLLAALLPPAVARAEPACLPASLFPKSEDEWIPKRLDLGLVAGTPTLCALNDEEHGGLLGCWAVDPTIGALSASSATALPGHSQRAKTDASGCIGGYCTTPKTSADGLLLWATSTDGAHAVVLRERTLYVFDAKTKQQTSAIPISDDKQPQRTNVGNEPVEILYVGNSLYVVGSDAGPFIAVWSYKDDGTRNGIVTQTGDLDNDAYSVFDGAVNVLDESHIALADAGLQTMLIIAADGTRQRLVRPAQSAPCMEAEMHDLGIDDASEECKKTITKNFEPYFDLDPIRLPSGDFLAALSGKGLGSLAILDGNALVEKKRFALPRCTN